MTQKTCAFKWGFPTKDEVFECYAPKIEGSAFCFQHSYPQTGGSHPFQEQDPELVKRYKAAEKLPLQSIHSTNLETKKAHFQTFSDLLKNQFEDGSGKYAVEGFEDMEATDLICKLWEKPGVDEVTWILKTVVKYIFRFERKHREKDLLKIATYCYILWLKMGFHLNQQHDTDTKGLK